MIEPNPKQLKPGEFFTLLNHTCAQLGWMVGFLMMVGDFHTGNFVPGAKSAEPILAIAIGLSVGWLISCPWANGKKWLVIGAVPVVGWSLWLSVKTDWFSHNLGGNIRVLLAYYRPILEGVVI
jgi:hypothetical protein